MLSFELGEVLTVQQYAEMIDWMVKNNYEQEYVKLPDDRLVKWFDDRMIHQFLFDPVPVDQPEPKVHGPKFDEPLPPKEANDGEGLPPGA